MIGSPAHEDAEAPTVGVSAKLDVGSGVLTAGKPVELGDGLRGNAVRVGSAAFVGKGVMLAVGLLVSVGDMAGDAVAGGGIAVGAGSGARKPHAESAIVQATVTSMTLEHKVSFCHQVAAP